MKKLVFSILLLVLGVPVIAFGAMSSTNYEIRFDSINFGGDNTSSSTSYQLRDSVGEIAAGSSADNYMLDAGFRGGIFDRTATFETFIQNSATQVAVTSYSAPFVTVTTTVGLAIGDMVLIVENEGLSQSSVMGRISSIVGPDDFIIDSVTGADLSGIDGVNDYVYKLDGTAISFGTLTVGTSATGVIAWEVNAEVDQGYAVYVYEDTNLTNGSAFIADVTDGTVSAGSSEYGGRSSDSSIANSTFDTQDTAITSNFQVVGDRSAAEFASRDFLTLKVARSGSQKPGNYSHNITVVYVGDY